LPGDTFGVELGQTHRLSAEAVAACDVLMVRRSLLDKAAAESPAEPARCLRLSGTASPTPMSTP
jgi:hypothetical protein